MKTKELQKLVNQHNVTAMQIKNTNMADPFDNLDTFDDTRDPIAPNPVIVGDVVLPKPPSPPQKPK
jgi:hypothetical protein